MRTGIAEFMQLSSTKDTGVVFACRVSARGLVSFPPTDEQVETCPNIVLCPHSPLSRHCHTHGRFPSADLRRHSPCSGERGRATDREVLQGIDRSGLSFSLNEHLGRVPGRWASGFTASNLGRGRGEKILFVVARRARHTPVVTYP